MSVASRADTWELRDRGLVTAGAAVPAVHTSRGTRQHTATTLRPYRATSRRHLPSWRNLPTWPTDQTRLPNWRTHFRISTHVRWSQQWKLEAWRRVLAGLATSCGRLGVQWDPFTRTLRQRVPADWGLLRAASVHTSGVLPWRGTILSHWKSDLAYYGHAGAEVLQIRPRLLADQPRHASLELLGLRLHV